MSDYTVSIASLLRQAVLDVSLTHFLLIIYHSPSLFSSSRLNNFLEDLDTLLELN
jgi:hypothetical protein